MKPNQYLINFVRRYWFWFWRRLMDGFAPSDENGNYKRPKGLLFDNKLKIETLNDRTLYLLIGSTCPWSHSYHFKYGEILYYKT